MLFPIIDLSDLLSFAIQPVYGARSPDKFRVQLWSVSAFLSSILSLTFNDNSYLGTIFPEHEGYSSTDIALYYVQHIIGAFMGPVIMCLSGRFDTLAY